jgi:hypothetical protein
MTIVEPDKKAWGRQSSRGLVMRTTVLLPVDLLAYVDSITDSTRNDNRTRWINEAIAEKRLREEGGGSRTTPPPPPQTQAPEGMGRPPYIERTIRTTIEIPVSMLDYLKRVTDRSPANNRSRWIINAILEKQAGMPVPAPTRKKAR